MSYIPSEGLLISGTHFYPEPFVIKWGESSVSLGFTCPSDVREL